MTYTVGTSSGQDVEIGRLRSAEIEDLFALFAQVVAAGQGYPHAAPLTRTAFEETWVPPVTVVVAARTGAELAGAYYLKPNFPGRGAHIANAGYVVAAAHQGQGIGRALVADSVRRAPAYGFDAIQFNLVVASNPARPLYEQLGWREIGRVPVALDGEDAVIYWRAVGGEPEAGRARP